MKQRLNGSQVGDTLVEVMLASAVLSLVLAGAFTITNKATRINQNANERTNVSNLMQREVEFIRASHKQDPASFWGAVAGYEIGENTTFCDLTSGTNSRMNAFYMNDSLTNVPITFSGDGDMKDYNETDFFDIWVEPVDGGVTHADFFVYACWEGIGGEGMQRSGLVLRLSK